VIRAVAAGALLLAAACTPTVRLADERTTPPYPALLARGAAARAEVRAFVVRAPGSPPVTVVLERRTTGGGAGRPTLVLQPGILADATTWRFLAGAVVADHDVLLVDPPGCGRSDVPPPASSRDAYAPAWLAEHTLLALEAWEREGGARRDLVLVGHSLGGEVVLRALADPGLRARHGDLLARVRGAVLLAPADLAVASFGPEIADVAELTDLEAGIGCTHGLAARKVAEAIRANAASPSDALAQEAERLAAYLCRPASRHAAQAMLRRFRPQDARGRAKREALAPLLAQERGIATPILVLWGEEDDTLPFAQAAPLVARLPSARLESLPGAKHSIQQERAEDVAARVRRFVASLPRSP
jgi:pimeloyl-ACP methyl ester carboxylesterase